MIDQTLDNLSKAVSEAEHYLEQGVENFRIRIGDIEIRRGK